MITWKYNHVKLLAKEKMENKCVCVLSCELVNLGRPCMEGTSGSSQKGRTTMLVINLLPLSSKFNLHCLLCNSGAGPYKISLAMTMMFILLAEGTGGTLQEQRAPLPGSRLFSFASCIYMWLLAAIGVDIQQCSSLAVVAKFTHWSPNPQYLRMWVHLDIGSLKG